MNASMVNLHCVVWFNTSAPYNCLGHFIHAFYCTRSTAQLKVNIRPAAVRTKYKQTTCNYQDGKLYAFVFLKKYGDLSLSLFQTITKVNPNQHLY